MNTDGTPILKEVSRNSLFFAADTAATALSEIRFPESELD
jgi:hypothetical protein